MSQLYILHFEYMETAFKGVYAIMDARTTETYNAMWQLIFELVPELRSNVKRMALDCERAAANSARTSFDDVKIELCYFHVKYVSWIE